MFKSRASADVSVFFAKENQGFFFILVDIKSGQGRVLCENLVSKIWMWIFF